MLPLRLCVAALIFLTTAFAETPKVYVISTGGMISGGTDASTGQPRSVTARDLVNLVRSPKD